MVRHCAASSNRHFLVADSRGVLYLHRYALYAGTLHAPWRWLVHHPLPPRFSPRCTSAPHRPPTTTPRLLSGHFFAPPALPGRETLLRALPTYVPPAFLATACAVRCDSTPTCLRASRHFTPFPHVWRLPAAHLRHCGARSSVRTALRAMLRAGTGASHGLSRAAYIYRARQSGNCRNAVRELAYACARQRFTSPLRASLYATLGSAVVGPAYRCCGCRAGRRRDTGI